MSQAFANKIALSLAAALLGLFLTMVLKLADRIDRLEATVNQINIHVSILEGSLGR